MEVLINSKSEVEHEIEIVVPYAELQPHFDKAYRSEAKNIVLPGFRKGRAPLQMIKKRFGNAIEYQVIEKLSNDYFKEAVEERDIHTVGQPQLVDMDYEPGENLTLKVTYETAPDIVAADYKGVQLERLTHEVTDEEIDEEMQQLRKNHRKLEEVEKADGEDYLVTCEIQALDDDGKPVPEKKNENLKVELDDENVHRDLKAELLNMKAGEEKDIELTHEHEDHQHIERAHVKVKTVERIELPEVDDTFASEASQGKATNVEQLRDLVITSLVASWEQRYKTQLETDLVEEIIKRNPFEVANGVITTIIDGWIEQTKESQPGKELPPDFDLDGYRKYREPEAISAAKWMYLRDSIVTQEKLTVDDSDLMAKAEKDSEQIGIDKEKLLEYYKGSPQFTDNLLAEKLLGWLLDSAEIKEIDDNDISKLGMEAVKFSAASIGDNAESAEDEDTGEDAGT